MNALSRGVWYTIAHAWSVGTSSSSRLERTRGVPNKFVISSAHCNHCGAASAVSVFMSVRHGHATWKTI